LSKCIVEIDVNYPGNDLIGKGNVASAGECKLFWIYHSYEFWRINFFNKYLGCNLCGSTTGCASWSYYLDYNYCFLKTASTTLASNSQPYPGIMSGFVSI
jgi:hypothetical protein